MSAGPCDRSAAESALRRFYGTLVFVGQPREIIWARSPEEFRLFCSRHQTLGEIVAFLRTRGRLGNLNRSPPRDDWFRRSVSADFFPNDLESVTLFPGDRAPDPPEDSGDDGDDRPDPGNGIVPVWMGEAIFTQLRFPWGDEGVGWSLVARAVFAVLGQCAAFFAGLGVAILCEGPAFPGPDESGRPHGSGGPFAVYPSGWCRWAWHGQIVGEDLHRRLRAV